MYSYVFHVAVMSCHLVQHRFDVKNMSQNAWVSDILFLYLVQTVYECAYIYVTSHIVCNVGTMATTEIHRVNLVHGEMNSMRTR